jgi:hypothetical protein
VIHSSHVDVDLILIGPTFNLLSYSASVVKIVEVKLKKKEVSPGEFSLHCCCHGGCFRAPPSV